MIHTDLTQVKQLDKIEVICDECADRFQRTKKNIRVSRKRHGRDLCQSCAAKLSVKPQNTKDFWAQEGKKEQLSQSLRNSTALKEAHALMDRRRSKNPRFGIPVTKETRAKMSASRTGKLGIDATAWKGGKNSINKRVKKCQQTRYNWFGRVLLRSNYICEKCGEKAKDAHHIEPICKLTRRLLQQVNVINDDEAVEWLLQQPEIIDRDLNNGMALCRPCHTKVHNNWGSRIDP
jgi:predicted amidophosphoribosyltransferase